MGWGEQLLDGRDFTRVEMMFDKVTHCNWVLWFPVMINNKKLVVTATLQAQPSRPNVIHSSARGTISFDLHY